MKLVNLRICESKRSQNIQNYNSYTVNSFVLVGSAQQECPSLQMASICLADSLSTGYTWPNIQHSNSLTFLEFSFFWDFLCEACQLHCFQSAISFGIFSVKCANSTVFRIPIPCSTWGHSLRSRPFSEDF